MKPAHRRRLGGAAAAALAAGLLAAPAAAAAETGLRVTGTTASPQPGIVSAGVLTDACDAATAPGWIGRTIDGPTLKATVASDTTGTLSARFSVRDQTAGDTAAFSAVREASAWNKEASTLVPGLVDGHSYAWNARALQGHKISPASPDCHFKVDLTSAQPAVSSTDFPPLGSGQKPGKYAGETAAFVLTGTDPVPAGGGEASGLACYRYAFNDNSGLNGGCAGDSVKPGPDGIATLTTKVKEWGTNILYVQAVDNAGNVSFTTSYSFYAPSDPRPKPSVLGDVDGDGVRDILLPDAAGNLQIIGTGSADTTPTSVLTKAAAPNRVSWSGFQTAHRGWRGHAPMDDVLVHQPGSPALYFYYNTDNGAFRQYPSVVTRPTGCQDAAGADAACPADYAPDWSKADQTVALGSLNTQLSPSLLTVENGDLWLFANPGLQYRLSTARKLTAGGLWTGYDLVAPGADKAGNLALWARERANGALHAYAVPKKGDGTFDFSALADPSAGVVATGFTPDAYPTLGSEGDLDGDGTADLWAVGADRHLLRYSGWTAPKDLGVLR
ncbi:hypothetical protein [Kitasatospora sp. NBC_00458]|uniref:hypothetical protein n=1 Tax=Kitasatospora sp. NBC_00458 TaxID=2903568 RepID=UPI002E17B43C